MKYSFNEEERAILVQMCDICLKSGGLQNLEPIQKVLAILSRPAIEEG